MNQFTSLLNQFIMLFFIPIFHVCTTSGQNLNPKHDINLQQTKAMQIISFTCYDAHTLYLQS